MRKDWMKWPFKTEFSSPDPKLWKTILLRRPTHVPCKNCEKFIASTLPWSCGHCGRAHPRVRLYSFLFKCKECKREPEGIVCPHCQRISPLKGQSTVRHPARPYESNKAAPVETKSPPSPRDEHLSRKERLQFQIDEAKLTLELRELEAKILSARKLNFKETLETKFEEDSARFLFVRQLVEKWKKEYEEIYRDNPDMLERALLFLQQWEIDHLPD
jgi:hypothetical protein